MKDFVDYVLKNKYVLICVAIVLVLYAFGIVEFLTKIIILVALLAGAVYVGKKIQDNEEVIKNFFANKGFGKRETYYYEENIKSSKK